MNAAVSTSHSGLVRGLGECGPCKCYVGSRHRSRLHSGAACFDGGRRVEGVAAGIRSQHLRSRGTKCAVSGTEFGKRGSGLSASLVRLPMLAENCLRALERSAPGANLHASHQESNRCYWSYVVECPLAVP